ncbi:ABC transporter permease [Tichowtungia aerotolerans]|uniref:ABC transporter permease subunit n=1 Tax=Tichowtungia aerotolerans TaxID=2697043 RepID=A0A6P1M4B7_9BACT|nr:ABC transporter permease subunit [Tichowtungia aerotolerans]
MIRYIAKRMLQMIPTVLGVILITFILFNVAGGSPALRVLGPHAQADTLEAFDELRGFNKPLFPLIGPRSVTTRAYEDSDFERTPGDWQHVDGVTYTNGMIVLAAGGEYALPVKFELRDDCDYELTVESRQPDISRDWKKEHKTFQSSEIKLGGGPASLEVRSIKLRRRMSNPFDSQLLFYFKQLAKLDFGVSHSTNQRVSKLLADGIGPSLMLTVPIFLIGLVTSITLSLLCAFWRDTWVDRFFVIISVALMSVNYLVYIVAGQYFLAFKARWFPIWGFEDVQYLALPVLIGVISGLGGSLRFYRTIMLDEAHRDYVRTARAKGVSKSRVLFRHVLKNAMIPIITNVVIAIPFLYTGSLLLESFFGIPGLGYLGINAINSSDVDVVRAIVLIGAFMFVIANLLTDLCYALVDPRVKLK